MYETPSGRQDHTTATGARPLRPLLAGAGALIAAGLLAAPAQAAFPGDNGRVVYERSSLALRAASAYNYWDGTELWTTDAKGGDAKLLVSFDGLSFPASAHDPSVSADGKLVAYIQSGESDTRFERIRIVGLDGSNDHLLRDDIDGASAPAWSPDGKQIVYADGHGTLAVVNADGTGSPQPIALTGLKAGATDPQWSPDGRWIAFSADRRVYVVPAGGGTPMLAGDRNDDENGLIVDSHPNWAPDGSAIVFERRRGYWPRAARFVEGTTELIEVPFERGVPSLPETPVAAPDAVPDRPVYSPDGLKLLYSGVAATPPAGGRTLHGTIATPGLVVSGADGSHAASFLSPDWYIRVTAADWAPIPKPAPAPAPKPPVVSVTPAPTGGVKGVAQYQCGSRRNFVIRLRPRGERIAMARVIVNGKRVKAHQGGRWTARVDLRTLPRKRFTVDVTVWTRGGTRFHEVRRYWTCTPAR
jgi:hypothetical protein